VEVEEGAGVEVVDVVFLCEKQVSRCIIMLIEEGLSLTGHVFGRPVCVCCYGDLIMAAVVAVRCNAQGLEEEQAAVEEEHADS